MKYAFFPGCTIAYWLPFIEKSIRLVSAELGIELIDLPFNCCPEPNTVRSFSSESWLVLAARNLALAEENGLDILTGCTGCLESLALAKHEIESKPENMEKVNQALESIGMSYSGKKSIIHMHQLLYDIIGIDKIGEHVKRSLKIRVVTHSGCHLLRPYNILQADDPEAPIKLDKLVEILGIEPLDYMDKTMCCGTGTRRANREASFAILREKMASMTMVEPDAAVVFCPSCFTSFESGQKIVNRMFGTNYRLPVYYYTELLALAMELSEMDTVLSGHRVKGPLSAISPENRNLNQTVQS